MDAAVAGTESCAGGECPVCASPITGYIRMVRTVRTHRDIPLYGCFDCRSMWNPSGYVEDERILRKDLEWGISVHERNIKASHALFDALAMIGEAPKRIVDIGCGIGTLLEVAATRGIAAIGFDTNHVATAYARSRGTDARTETWSAITPLPPVDMFLSIMCLEHLERPRALLAELCKAAVTNNASLFVSVPFVDKPSWRYVVDPDPKAPGSPFLDCDVHVTHFSSEGLAEALRQHGLAKLQWVRSHLWHGYLARA